MEPRKFYIGEKIIGNEQASSYYSITRKGWIGVVVENCSGGDIRVRGVGEGSSWRVNERCFDSYYPREPLRNEDGKAICDQCGEAIEDEEELVWVKGKAICRKCAEEYYVKCAKCGELVLKEKAINVDGITLCKDCAESADWVYRCRECGELHLRISGYARTAYGGYLCPSCRDGGRYATCEDCGSWFLVEDLTTSPRDRRRRCADCERSFKGKCIKEYGYKPDPIFKVHNHTDEFSDTSIKELLFGVELEIDKGTDREDCALELLEATPDIYCKRDGSLCDGIEIVTHPCTLEYHMKDIGWEKLSEIALKYDFRSQEARTCGLHVHVGRRQMGKTLKERKETAAKIVLLADRHWESLVKFSRRTSSQLERWAERPDVEYDDVADGDISLVDAALATKRNGRYQAINLENASTVEFRLFNGTLKVNTIFATLQLVSRMVSYAKEKTVEQCMMSTWKDIVGGNLIDSAEYTELSEYLEARGLTEGEAPTEYDWKASEPVEFNVGDKVVIANGRGSGVNKLSYHIGEVATIAYVYESESSSYDYIVDFGHEGIGLHSANGKLPGPTGYMVYKKNLKKWEEE